MTFAYKGQKSIASVETGFKILTNILACIRVLFLLEKDLSATHPWCNLVSLTRLKHIPSLCTLSALVWL